MVGQWIEPGGNDPMVANKKADAACPEGKLSLS